MPRRKAKLRHVGGHEWKSHPNRVKVQSFYWYQIESWFHAHRDRRPFAAVATRRLRFSVINQLLDDRPPSVLRHEDKMRIYLFRTGEDRDSFVETFHGDYRAKAIIIGARRVS